MEPASLRPTIRRSHSRAIVLWLLSALALLVIPACGSSSGTPKNSAPSFNFVSYNQAGVLPDGQGSLSQILDLNKPIVLNFWGGDCPPCRAEMPAFQEVANQYQGEVIFIGIDVGPFTSLGTHGSAQQLLKDLNITYPTAYAVDEKPLLDYNLQGIPTTVLITKDHTIMTTKSGLMSKSDLLADVTTLVSK